MLFRRSLLAALSLLLAFSAAADAPVAPPLTLSGQLVDEAGRPLAGGSVAVVPAPDRSTLGRWRLGLEPEAEPVARATTDQQGLFALPLPAPGNWRLQLRTPDRITRENTLTVVQPVEVGPLPALPTRPHAVRIVDAAGQPVAGARVTYLGFETAVETGAEGRAVLDLPEGMAGGDVLVVPFGRSPQAVRLRDSETRVTLPEIDRPNGAVTVRDAAGEPVPQAVLWLWGQPVEATDAQGKGHSAAATPRYADTLEVTASGRRSGRLERQASVLQLVPPVRLTGRVRTAGKGEPVAGALVWPAGHPGEVTRSDAEGRFDLLASAPKEPELALVVAAAGFVAARVPLRPGGPPADLRLTPAATVAGQVVDPEGRPQDGFLVSAERREDGAADLPSPRFRTGPDGRFRLAGLEPGVAYELVAVRFEVARGQVAVAALAAGEGRAGVRLPVTAFRIATGRVVDTAGEPVAGAAAALTRVDEAPRFFGSDSLGQPGSAARRESDGAGRFRIPGLEPGRYDLRVRAPGFAPVTVRGLTIPARGGEVDLGTVHLGAAVVLRGRVVDAEDEPVADAEITHLQNQIGFFERLDELSNRTSSAADGSFEIADLTPGATVVLTVSHPGFVRQDVPGVRVPREGELVIPLVAAGRVRGRVIDGEGRGVEGAQVGTAEARWDGGTTDPAGAFLLEGVPPGTVQLVATAPGFLDPPGKTLEIGPGEELSDVVFQVDRGAVVSGRVVGADGAPIEEAYVFLRDSGGDGSEYAQTGADGRYRIEGVQPGDRRFTARAEGLLPQVKSLTVRASENPLDFRLDRGLEIRGRVVGPEGQAVDQGEVTATEDPDGLVQERGAIHADGSFEILNVKPGRYRLRADSLDFAPGELPDPVTVGPASVEGVVIPLTRGGLIVGRVRGLDFDRLAELQVIASSLDGSRYSGGQVDYQGGFVIKNITAGTWMVMASAGNRQALARAEVEPGATETRVEVEFGEGFTLSGRVSRGGRPVVNAGVAVTTRREIAGGFTTTDHDGRFEVHDLTPGEYQVVVATNGNGFAHSEAVTIDGDREIAIEVVGRVVAGRVVASDGEPLPNAKVNLRDTSPTDFGGWGSEATSDEAGHFRFVDVAPNRYVLHGRKEGYAQGQLDLEVSDADVETELPLTPSPGLVLEVATARGPLPSGAVVAVAAVDDSGRVVFRGHGEADEGGRVRLSSVPLGTWTLWLSSHGYALTRLRATNPGSPVPVALAPGVELQVEIPALRGTTEIARLTLTGADGQALPTLHQGLELTYEHMVVFGQTQIGEVPPGRWTLRVVTAAGETLEKTVEAPAGVVRVVVE
jgi:protocatechuate 3,4-dioxygenase beta subunit